MDTICPRCGKHFECRHNQFAECHCTSVVLDAQQLEYIGQNYDGCLCHACLLDMQDCFYTIGVNPLFIKANRKSFVLPESSFIIQNNN
jgi:hypothetical protein